MLFQFVSTKLCLNLWLRRWLKGLNIKTFKNRLLRSKVSFRAKNVINVQNLLIMTMFQGYLFAEVISTALKFYIYIK